MKVTTKGNAYDPNYINAARLFVQALIQKGCYSYITLDQICDALEARQRDARVGVLYAIRQMKQEGLLSKTSIKSVYSVAIS